MMDRLGGNESVWSNMVWIREVTFVVALVEDLGIAAQATIISWNVSISVILISQ